MKMFVSDSVEKAIKDKEDELKKNKCVIDYNIDYYIRKQNSKEVITKFLKEYRTLKNKNEISLSDIVDYLTTNTFSGGKEVLGKSLEALTYELLRNMPNAVSDVLSHDIQDDAFTEEYGKEIPFSILKFYCYFNYGLDKIYSSSNDTLLRDIFEGRKFDYSQLDLSLFEDHNMTCDITINNYTDQVLGINNEYNKKDANYKKALNDYNNFLSKVGNSNPLVESKLKSICQSLKDSFDKIKNIKNKMDNFDLNKYIKNLNIINHLRNSIAHGNYELDDSDIDNKYFIFNYIFNGGSTYKLKIRCVDFAKLFDSKNKIHHYLENLSREYLDKSMDRIHKEEVLLDSAYVKEDCMNSWNKLVTSVLDGNDKKEIRKIMLAYYCMKEIYTPSVYISNKDKYEYAVGITLSRIFGSSTISPKKNQVIKMNGELVSLSDYEDIIKNIINYSKVIYKYDSYITKQLLSISEEGSILDKLYNNKSKKR